VSGDADDEGLDVALVGGEADAGEEFSHAEEVGGEEALHDAGQVQLLDDLSGEADFEDVGAAGGAFGPP